MENFNRIYEHFCCPAADGSDHLRVQHNRLSAPCHDRVR